MGVRRITVVAAIIVCALMSYFYLANKYNPDSVEFYFKENIPYKDYEKLRESNRDILFNMNYITQYQGNRLIMTTGFDYLTKELELSKGSFLADNSMREAVIGDMVAEKYYRNSNVIGQLKNIFGEEYKVKGIIQRSNEVYILYDDKLKDITWQKKIINCSINDKKHFYLKAEQLQNQLDSLEVEILDVVAYREEMNKYTNIAILATSYILACYLFMLIRKIRNGLKKLWKEYLENSRVVELRAYLLKEVREIAVVMCFCLFGLTLLYGIYKLLSNLYIPPSMVPDNLFSPSSYINVVRLLYRRYLARLENGIDGILVDIKIVNAVFIMIVLSIGTIAHKIYSLDKIVKGKSYD